LLLEVGPAGTAFQKLLPPTRVGFLDVGFAKDQSQWPPVRSCSSQSIPMFTHAAP
jgi:hypothetical protein